MNAVANEVFVPLTLDISVNASDGELIRNLRASKERNVPILGINPPRPEPLVICGSGPSLRRTMFEIPEGARIMAINGAYRFLLENGIVPHIFLCIDARPVNVNFLEKMHPDTAFLMASQVHPDVWAKTEGFKRGMFHLHSPTHGVVYEPGEVTTFGSSYTAGLCSLIIGPALGYRALHLFGFDSSFEAANRNVFAQEQNSGHAELEVEFCGRKYRTTHAMAGQVTDFFQTMHAVNREWPDVEFFVRGDGLFYDFVCTNNQPPSRERELGKYKQIYHTDQYGMTKERRDGVAALLSQEFKRKRSFFDVSTGRGETLHLAKEAGFEIVRGSETVLELLAADIDYAVLPNLPHCDKSFDVVSLIEVIEHILPEDVELSLRELDRVARDTILISAATVPHWLGGVNLHPSARSEEEWQELFDRVWPGKNRRVGNLGSSPAWRIDL